MPTKIQTMPSEQRPFDKIPPSSNASHPNSQWAHKEALRVAIGSILAPKRPQFHPGSHSTSGSASPYSFPTSQSHTPGTVTPVHPSATAFGGPNGEYLHPHHVFLQTQHLHPHTPSKLAHSVAESPPATLSPAPRPTDTAKKLPSEPIAPAPVQNQSAVTEAAGAQPQAMARPNMSPLQPMKGGDTRAASMPEVQTEKVSRPPGSRTPTHKSKFVEKLQSKSAWDALIHGSFS